MSVNSVDIMKQQTNSVITVSCPTCVLKGKYMAQGVIEVAVSTLSASFPAVIKDIPYNLVIVDAAFNNYAFGKAAHAISLYKNTSAASNIICDFKITASRTFGYSTTLNFNNTEIAPTDKILIAASGASANKVSGVLYIMVRPI